MAMWRCPHCNTPQTESARCWVCHRSSTACGTCRHFRRSVAAQLGYCGLDKQRVALRGDEIRGCWEARAAPPSPSASVPVGLIDPAAGRTDVRRLEFIPVVPTAPLAEGETGRRPARRRRRATPQSDPAGSGAFVDGSPEPRWNLWGDLDG